MKVIRGKNMKWKTKSSSFKRIIFCILIVLFIVSIGIIGGVYSYAFWTKNYNQNHKNIVDAGCLSFTFNDKDINSNVANIELSNAYPMSDTKGLGLKPYVFTVSNNCNLKGQYSIYLHNLSKSTIESKHIKIALFNNDILLSGYPLKIGELSLANFNGSLSTSLIDDIGISKEDYLLYVFNLSPLESQSFKLLLWLDKDAPNSTMGLTYESALSIYAIPTK